MLFKCNFLLLNRIAAAKKGVVTGTDVAANLSTSLSIKKPAKPLFPIAANILGADDNDQEQDGATEEKNVVKLINISPEKALKIKKEPYDPEAPSDVDVCVDPIRTSSAEPPRSPVRRSKPWNKSPIRIPSPEYRDSDSEDDRRDREKGRRRNEQHHHGEYRESPGGHARDYSPSLKQGLPPSMPHGKPSSIPPSMPHSIPSSMPYGSAPSKPRVNTEKSDNIASLLSAIQTANMKPAMAPAAIQSVLDTINSATRSAQAAQSARGSAQAPPPSAQSLPPLPARGPPSLPARGPPPPMSSAWQPPLPKQRIETREPAGPPVIDPMRGFSAEQMATLKATAATLQKSGAPVIQQVLPYLNAYKKQNAKVAAGVKPLWDSLSLKRTIVQDVPAAKKSTAVQQPTHINPTAPTPPPPQRSISAYPRQPPLPKSQPHLPIPEAQPKPPVHGTKDLPGVKIASASAANVAQNLVNNLVSTLMCV